MGITPSTPKGWIEFWFPHPGFDYPINVCDSADHGVRILHQAHQNSPLPYDLAAKTGSLEILLEVVAK